MTVNEYLQQSQSTAYAQGDLSAAISGGYAGDFLSHVMGSAPRACIWFTVMNNVNVAAVAHLAECAAVVICEGTEPDEQLLQRCNQQGINLLRTPLTVYDACAEFAGLVAILKNKS